MPEDSLAKAIIRRYEALKAARGTTESVWQEIADHELGRRNFTTEESEDGRKRTVRIYDDTAKKSGMNLAGALHSLMMNPAGGWFRLRYEDERLNENQEAAFWLFQAERRLYNAIQRPEAGFHAQQSENWSDIVFFGTDCMFIEDVPGSGVRFSSRPLGEMHLAEDPSGQIDTRVRRFRLTNRQAVDLWGQKAARAAREVSDQPEARLAYLHAVVRRDDPGLSLPRDDEKPWASIFVAFDDPAVLSVGGFHEQPIVVSRWNKDSGEVYGRGPGWEALSDAKMLNAMKRTLLTAAEKLSDPPWLVDSDGVLGDKLNVEPGGVVAVNTVTSALNPPVQSLVANMSGFPITAQVIEQTRQQVRDAFAPQLFEAIRDPRMTATQVLELSGLVSRTMAPIIGRQKTEKIEPLLERVFSIEARSGRMPAPPPFLAGIPLAIEHVSPVSRAQQSSEARAVIDLFTVGANLSQFDPDVLHRLSGDAGIKILADILGVPPKIVRSDREVQRRMEAARRVAEDREMERKMASATEIAASAKAAEAA